MKRLLFPSVAVGATLALLASAWFYVANVAEIRESTRNIAKETVFWLGMGTLMLYSARLSVGAHRDWWKRTTAGVAVATFVAAGTYSSIRLVLGGNSEANSYFLGEPAIARILELIAAYAIILSGAVVFGLGVGALARLIIRARSSQHRSGEGSA